MCEGGVGSGTVGPCCRQLQALRPLVPPWHALLQCAAAGSILHPLLRHRAEAMGELQVQAPLPASFCCVVPLGMVQLSRRPCLLQPQAAGEERPCCLLSADALQNTNAQHVEQRAQEVSNNPADREVWMHLYQTYWEESAVCNS